MQWTLFPILLLLSLGACVSDEEGISGSSTPPAASGPARSAEIIGSLLWNPVAQTADEAQQRLSDICARHGLEARTTGETQKGASVTTDYICE